MAQKEDKSRETTPPRMADVKPSSYQSSNDYSYMEIIMTMQNTMGKLTEAVESLKTDSRIHGDKLEQIGKDVHGAKLVGTALVLVGGFLGWVIHELIPLLSSFRQH